MAAPLPRDETRDGYEFTALENKKFTRLAGAMQIVAVLEVVAAALGTVPAVTGARTHLATGDVLAALVPIGAVIAPLLVGLWTFRAGGHLRLIVRTQGDDIRHLMAAVTELTKLYLLQLWLFLFTIGVVVFSLLVHGAYVKLY